MKNKNTQELSILFSSFDKFADVLPLTHHYFLKNWNDCKYEIYWGSNGKEILNFNQLAPDWKYIREKENDIGWSDNLLSYLKALETKYILLILDDFLLMKKPNESKIEEAIHLMKEYNAPYCRLNSSPAPDKKINEDFGLIKYFSRYRSSLQPSIWERDFLILLLEKYRVNPWQFEDMMGIVPESIDRNFIASFDDFIGANHCIEKNQWIKPFIEILNKEGLEIDYSSRGVIDMDIVPHIKKEPYSIMKLIKEQIKFHRRKILKKGIFKISIQDIKKND